MKARDVTDLYNLLENNGIKVWLDGGWGVDALLGKQTRNHEDVDIVVQEKDLSKIRELLVVQGYKDVERNDTTDWNFVLGDDKRRLVDIHAFHFDSEGNGLYGNRGLTYPASSLTGVGKIAELEVRCISAEQVIKFHSGYKLKEKDFQDVSALCKKFGIDLPEGYTRLKNNHK